MSRISSIKDGACMWTESPKTQATLAIPGLQGQPAMCLSTLTASNTLSVTAFGWVVWSCILRGEVKLETGVFEAKESTDMIPIMEYEVEKRSQMKDGAVSFCRLLKTVSFSSAPFLLKAETWRRA
jgi:hypothetical protein